MENKLFLSKSLKSNLRWAYLFLGIIIMISFGTVYSWSIFRIPVEKAFNVGSTQSGLPYMTSLAFYALFMMITGRFLERYSPRAIVLTGAILLSLGWILSSFTTNIYALTITYGVIGGAGVGIAYGVPMAIVAKWFPDKKGFASGVVLLGFGVSPLITAPLAGYLIQVFGVMRVFLILGISFGIIIPIFALPFKYPSEAEVGDIKKSGGNDEVNTNTKEMIKKESFKGLYINFIIASMIGLMLIGMTSKVGIQLIGLTQKRVAFMVSMFAIFNGIGRPVFGFITDRLSSKKAMLISYSLIITAAFVMLFAKEGSQMLYAMAFSMFWMNLGGWLAIVPASTSLLFGPKHYSQNYGLIFTAYGIGAILGVSGSGIILDIFGNYNYIFYLIIGLCILGSLVTIRTIK